MKKTMRGYSWICLVAGLVWLACGQMEAVACLRGGPTWLVCTNCNGLRKYYKKGDAYPCDDKPSPGKPRLALRDTGEVTIQDTPVAFYPPKGAPLEFTMMYNSHGGMDYLNINNGGGGWNSSILREQWTHSFEWGLEHPSTSDYVLTMPGKRHVHFTHNNDDTFTTETEKLWHSWHSSERYEASWLIENDKTNILVRNVTWSTMQCSQKKGCTTCGGNGGGNQSDIPHAPYSAWHAAEGFVFELTNGNYRLLKKISRDGEALTCSYNSNNQLTNAVNSLGDSMSFYYAPISGQHTFLTNIQVRHAGAVIRSASIAYDPGDGDVMSLTDMATNTFIFEYSVVPHYPNDKGFSRIKSMSSPSSIGNYETITIDHGMVPDSSAWTSDWTRVMYPEGDWRVVDLQRSGDQYKLLDKHPGGTNMFYFSTNVVDGARIPTNSVDALGRVTQYEFDTNYINGSVFSEPHLSAQINPDGTREEYDYTNEYHRTAAIRYYTAPTNGTDRQLYQEKKWYYTDFSGVQCADVVTNDVWGLDSTNGWSLLSRKVSEYTRYDRDTGDNPADDVYALMSEKRWIDANTFTETCYLYDTNTFLMTNIQQRTSSNGDFRTVENFRWNQTNQLTEVVDALNYTNGVTYDDYYRVASVWQYRTNLVTRFTYDSLDQVLTKVYPDNTKEAWTYNSCLCGSATYTNRDGSVTETIYDRNERPINRSTRTAVVTLLNSESYAYDYNGRITNIWDAASNVVESVYNTAGELIREIDAINRYTIHEYSDISGQLYMTTHPDGTFTSNRYDIAGRVVEVCQYDANTYPLAANQYGYDGMGRQIWTKDALGNVTSNEYDMLSRVIRTTYPDRSWSASGYDLLGNLIWQQQNGITIMTNTYDELNRRRAAVNALNQTNKWTYDPDWPNQIQSEINATGSVFVVNTYAPTNGLLITQVRMGVTNFFKYDAGGQLTNTVFSDGTVASRFYDGPRMTSQVDRAGYTNVYLYDILGRVTNVLVSGQMKQVSTYDEVGNLLCQYDPLWRTNLFAYDEMNRQTNAIRPDGGGITNQYDAFGRLANQFGAGRLPVAYGYDAMGHMTNLVDGKNNPTQWQYDSMGRVTNKIYADNKNWAYAYNGDGWLTNRMDGNRAETYYTYNVLGQLTNIHYAVAGMTNVSMGYDTLGRMTSRVDVAGTWYWTYVGDSSLKATEQLVAAWDLSGNYTIAYGYNALLDLTNVSVNGTSVEQYSWQKGRLDKVYVPTLGKTNQYHWNATDNRLDGWVVIDGGLTNKRTYDAVGQLLGTTNYGMNGVISGFAYTYDSVGRRTRRLDNQTVTNAYGYDYADQLTNAVRNAMSNLAANAAYDYTYEYDAAGNRSVGKRRNLIYNETYNNLNQLMTLSVTGKVPVYGEAAVTNIRVSSTNVQVSVYDETLGKYSWLGDVGIPTTNRGSGLMNIGVSAWNGTNHTVTNVMVYLPHENPQPFQ